jgi:hypothetical protein
MTATSVPPTNSKQGQCNIIVVGGETETTEMEAMEGGLRGGRREGDAMMMTALSGDSIRYWEMLATSTRRVAVGRMNVITGPFALERYWTGSCHKYWGGHTEGSLDPWAAATGVSVWGSAAQWNCSILLQTYTRMRTPTTP